MRTQRNIVVTGIAGRLGRLVARELHRSGEWNIIGIDRRVITDLPKDVVNHQIDIRSKRARDIFRSQRIDALIHLGIMHDLRQSQEEHHSWNVLGTTRLLEYCLEYSVLKVVVLSSADVYGPRADNQQFLSEEAPLLGAVDFPQIRALIEVDMQATSFFWRSKGSDNETVVLRPVHILGSVRNAPSNYLRLNRLPLLWGYDPMVQVVHEIDVAQAIMRSLAPKVHGVFNITGPAEVPLSKLVQESGKPTIKVPVSLLQPTLNLMWKLRVTNFPVPELAHIRFVGMVDGSRAEREMGYRPQYSLREAIQAALST